MTVRLFIYNIFFYECSRIDRSEFDKLTTGHWFSSESQKLLEQAMKQDMAKPMDVESVEE
jgi:hypothetical protein